MTEPILDRLLQREELSPGDVRRCMDLLVDGHSPEGLKTALLVALAVKGETTNELVAFARELRRRAVPFDVPGRHQALDLCGSGGAPRPSFNISTVSAFVVAASGQPVIKIGNRSARGNTGSSDLLEALGLPIIRSRKFSRESYRRFSLAFLHAPLYHPVTKAMGPVRQLIGIPTIFNRVGPLSNPAGVRQQLVGEADSKAATRVAQALQRLGVRRGLSVTAKEGSDEFSPSTETMGIAWNKPRVRRLRIRARDHLVPEDRTGPWGPLAPSPAAEATARLFAGAPGARRGAVLLTSGAALWVGGHADSIHDGVKLAQETLDSGAAETLFSGVRDLATSREWPSEA